MTQQYTDEAARFFASNPEGPVAVQCVSFHHPAWGGWTHATNYGRAWRANLETSELVDFAPLAFSLVEPGSQPGTDQRLTVAIDGYEGALYRALRELSADDRLTPITLVYRLYLDTDASSVVNAPPPSFEIRQINAETGKLTVSAVARNLASRPSGQFYTVERFPTLENQ